MSNGRSELAAAMHDYAARQESVTTLAKEAVEREAESIAHFLGELREYAVILEGLNILNRIDVDHPHYDPMTIYMFECNLSSVNRSGILLIDDEGNMLTIPKTSNLYSVLAEVVTSLRKGTHAVKSDILTVDMPPREPSLIEILVKLADLGDMFCYDMATNAQIKIPSLSSDKTMVEDRDFGYFYTEETVDDAGARTVNYVHSGTELLDEAVMSARQMMLDRIKAEADKLKVPGAIEFRSNRLHNLLGGVDADVPPRD